MRSSCFSSLLVSHYQHHQEKKKIVRPNVHVENALCRQLLSHVDGNFHISERWRELGASLTVVHRIQLYILWNYTNVSELKPETKAH